jgi:ABC-2 type transport system ATP-binding protein
MGSVETLCDNIALINRSHLILSGGVKEVKNRFRTKIYEVVYTGTAMDLAISLWSNFELIKNEKVDDHMVAHIRLLRDHTLNDLLGVLLKDLQIESVRELIPDMDAIFIQAVNSFNNNNNG